MREQCLLVLWSSFDAFSRYGDKSFSARSTERFHDIATILVPEIVCRIVKVNLSEHECEQTEQQTLHTRLPVHPSMGTGVSKRHEEPDPAELDANTFHSTCHVRISEGLSQCYRIRRRCRRIIANQCFRSVLSGWTNSPKLVWSVPAFCSKRLRSTWPENINTSCILHMDSHESIVGSARRESRQCFPHCRR